MICSSILQPVFPPKVTFKTTCFIIPHSHSHCFQLPWCRCNLVFSPNSRSVAEQQAGLQSGVKQVCWESLCWAELQRTLFAPCWLTHTLFLTNTHTHTHTHTHTNVQSKRWHQKNVTNCTHLSHTLKCRNTHTYDTWVRPRQLSVLLCDFPWKC